MKKGDVPDKEYSIVDILNATVIISVIPALVIMTLKSFIIAFLAIPSKLGIILNKKLIGKNIAKIINSTCENIMIPVSRNTNTEIPILKMNKKKTVPSLEIVFAIDKFALS